KMRFLLPHEAMVPPAITAVLPLRLSTVPTVSASAKLHGETAKDLTLKDQSDADLRREWDADRGAGTEEIAERPGGEEKLLATGDGTILIASRRIQAHRGDVREIIDRGGKGTDIGHVIVAWIVAVEEVEELDERTEGPTLVHPDRSRDPQIHLHVRRAAELV